VILEFLEGPDTNAVTAARQAAGLGESGDAIFLEVEF
jgi:hypothetical protein